MMMKMTKTKMMVIATQLLLKKDVSMNIEQAHKAQKSNSYLQIWNYEPLTDPLTHPLTGVGASRCYRI